MDEEEHNKLIKNALLLTFGDLDHLHEATELYTEYKARQIRRQSRDDSAAYGSDLLQSILGAENNNFNEDLLVEIRSEHKRLLELSFDDLQAHVFEIEERLKTKREAERPYNYPGAERIEYRYWTRKSIWSLEEAILLHLGREPSQNVINYLNNMSDHDRKESEFANAFFMVRALMQDAVKVGEISTLGKPIEYLDWLEKFQFTVSEELKNSIFEIHAPERLNPKIPQKNEIAPKERETLLKLVAAMAIRGYKFDPDAQRNQATSDIQSDLDHLGISLDQKTILKWIREACSLIPKEDR